MLFCNYFVNFIAYDLKNKYPIYIENIAIFTNPAWIHGRRPSPRDPPLTVIKMVHITITSFHINLLANKSYLLDIDPPEILLTPQIQNPGKYCSVHCSPPLINFRTQPSAEKVMATIFWDWKGVLLVDYLPQRTTMTERYYGAWSADKSASGSEVEAEGILTRGPLMLHGNAPAHMCRVAQAVVKDIGFKQLSHPPYSPDLTPSDFYLFRHLKQHLRGTRFFDDDELQQAIESYLDNMPQEFYLTGIKELFDRCQQCMM